MDHQIFNIKPCISADRLVNKVKIAFIGNSITFPPLPEIGWHNSNGIAATNKESDYAHRLLRLLNIDEQDAFIGNFAELERQESPSLEIQETIGKLLSLAPHIIIIQLGDNVGDDAQLAFFKQNLNWIFQEARASRITQKMLVLSTWWRSSSKDLAIKSVADENGVNFCFIGDIFDSKLNEDRRVKEYHHSGVDNHPRDWAMNQIAYRIFHYLK